MCVQPAAIVQGDADEQPDPEYLVPALLEAARQPQVLAALNCLYDGTGGCVGCDHLSQHQFKLKGHIAAAWIL